MQPPRPMIAHRISAARPGQQQLPSDTPFSISLFSVHTTSTTSSNSTTMRSITCSVTLMRGRKEQPPYKDCYGYTEAFCTVCDLLGADQGPGDKGLLSSRGARPRRWSSGAHCLALSQYWMRGGRAYGRRLLAAFSLELFNQCYTCSSLPPATTPPLKGTPSGARRFTSLPMSLWTAKRVSMPSISPRPEKLPKKNELCRYCKFSSPLSLTDKRTALLPPRSITPYLMSCKSADILSTTAIWP